MTQEEKAMAYDEAIKRAKEINNEQKAQPFDVMLKVFPELKESEDERVRKELLNYCKNRAEKYPNDPKYKNISAWIAWLEKQGHQEKPQVYKTEDGEVITYSENEGYKVVEPKFKVGDWIVSGYNSVAYIESISETKYNLQCKDGSHEKLSIDYINRCWHLWTIQDAKDGDVLSDGITIFIFKDLLSDGSVMSYCDYDANSGESDAFCPLSVNLVCSKITPATKEQRDLLFQKMKEARYEWDAKKKHLKQLLQHGSNR